MIECELCGDFFHPDEIKRCPKCDIELCSACYEKHVRKCTIFYEDSVEEESDKDIPKECPKCKSALELDINYAKDGNGYTKNLICSKPGCDFNFDVTDLLSDEENNDSI